MDTEVKKTDAIAFNPISHEGRLEYSGSTKGGQPDGRGRMLWNNGQTYEGFFKDDLFHGYGCLIYEEKSLVNFFEGLWKDDKKSGKGTNVWKDGSTYVGEWKDDFRDGFGKYTFEKESNYDFYEGQWKKGKN